MKKEPLLRIFERLGAYSQKHKVLSEGELRLKIRECLDSLTDLEREELERTLNGDVETQIFTSITSTEKISVFSPDLHTKTNYQGEVFYCLPTHGYLAEELEAAFLRWATIRSPLGTVKDVLTEFMRRCSYSIRDEPADSETDYLAVSAVKEDETRQHRLRLFIFSSIKFVPRFMDEHPDLLEKMQTEEEVVMAVPTEKTPAPFITFIREHEVGTAQIWVVDLTKRTVDPFIGTPSDPDVEQEFANPEQARRAVSVWMRKVPFVE
ncbi:MAG TPA: hypothetical protein VMW67_03515 [Desulfobacteria bacterium]|nr:hypothetical protein [Desulfobacteria bacterium]